MPDQKPPTGKSPAETSDSDSILRNKGESSVEISDSDSFFTSKGKSFGPAETAYDSRRLEDCNGGSYNGMLDLSLGSLSSYQNLNPNNGSPQNNAITTPLSEPPESSQQRSEFSAAALPVLPSSPRYYTISPSPPPPIAARATTKKKSPASSSSPSLRLGKSEIITPAYEWATNRRAGVHTLDYLQSKQITTITGDVQCKRCEAQYKMEFDLDQKFREVATYIWENRFEMAERAPDVWKNPILPTCSYCGQENSAKPVIGSSKKAINWLFLLLGQLLGCCTLDQLRYFCKHTRNHRTGAKDRVLYLAYLNLCKQLDPTGPFDR